MNRFSLVIMKPMRKSIIISFAASLAACAAGPDYKKPDLGTHVPAAYKENANWKPAQPADAIKRGAWWEIYGDPVLDDLMKQVNISNQSLKQAEAQYMQAAALVSQARASFWPTVSLSPAASRAGSYGTSTIVSGSQIIGGGSGGVRTSNQYSFPVGASWAPDLWGSVRRTVEGDVASAQASEATLESTRLSTQAQLAQAYFELRTADEQKRLLDDTVKAYQKTVDLTINQYNAGVAARSDVIAAQTQLKSTQVQQINAGIARAQYEHAIAMLIGKTPAEFSLAPQPLKAVAYVPQTDLPTTLLERRPDIANAERLAAQASAQIGVDVAAWFPSLTFSASAGFKGSVLPALFEAPNRFWQIGPALAQTLFDGGLRNSRIAGARANYDAAVANYRQVVLAAFQNVEDNLAGLRILEEEAGVQDEAVALAKRSLDITINQYRAGTASYINVITAQATAFSAEQNAITIRGTRLNDSVALIEALGGGWQSKDLPNADQIDRHSKAPEAAKD
jgi:NodT family efflux transporter outer membrane factor (OMF) lipoprotein